MRGVVGDTGQIKTVGQFDAEDLVVVCRYTIIHVDNEDGNLDGGERRLDSFCQTTKISARCAFGSDNRNTNDFLQNVVSDRESEGLADTSVDRRVGVGTGGNDGLLNLERTDEFTTTVDDFLTAASNVEVSVGVEVSHVTSVKPALIREARRVELVVFQVSAENRRAADSDATNGLVHNVAVIAVKNRDFGANGNTRCACAVELVVERGR